MNFIFWVIISHFLIVVKCESGNCEVKVSCTNLNAMRRWWEERGATVDSADVGAMCDGRKDKLLPLSNSAGVHQLVRHHMLQAIAELMLLWRRYDALFIIDHSSGFVRDEYIFVKRKIKVIFNWASHEDMANLSKLLTVSENVVILCNEETTFNLLKEINRLGTFNSSQTWIISGHQIPASFENIKLFSSTSFTFFKFNFDQFQTMSSSSCSTQDNSTSISMSLTTDQQMALAQRRGMEFGIFDVFHGFRRNATELVQFGVWRPTHFLRIFEDFTDEDRLLRLRGKMVRAVVFEHLPYSKLSYRGKTLVVEGYMKDLYDMLMDTLDLRYIVREIPPIYGIGINGTYTGFVGILYRKEAEISMNVLAYTNSRREGLRYAGPMTRGFLAICYNRPKPFVPPTTYWVPFEWDVWLTVLITFLVLVTFIGLGILTSPGSQQNPTLSQMFHSRLYRALTGTFFEEALDNPAGFSTKILYGALLMATLMLFNHYTSVFTSFLTLLEVKIPFTSLDDVITTQDYRVLYVENTRHQDMFQNAQSGLYAQVWEKIQSGSEKVSDFGTGLQMMYQKDYVYLTEGPTTLSLAANNCSVSFASATYMHEFFFFTTRTDFPYSKIISTMLMKIMESGIMNRQASVYNMHKRPPCVIASSSESLGLDQVIGVYILFAIGFGLTLLALVIEHIINSKYLRKRFKVKIYRQPQTITKTLITIPEKSYYFKPPR